MPAVRREVVLPVDPDRAWELITDPGELEGWLADDVELEPEEGGEVRVEWDDGERREGIVEEVDEGRRLVVRVGRGALARRVDARPRARRHPLRRHRAQPRAGRRPAHGGALGARLPVPGLSEPELGAVFAALADPTRRQVVRSLAREQAVTASGLAGELPMTRQAVAKHLAALERAGLVTPRREGRETRYRLTPEPLDEAIAWMADVGARWDRSLERLSERARRA